ncbi:hypothetical protein Tco_0828896 [Tanacetum coccineum]
MTSITAQQTKLDLMLVPKENRLVIGKCNGRIPRGLKPKEETFQVVLDALALTYLDNWDQKNIYLDTKAAYYFSRHSEWPTCNWKDDRYCTGGNLPGAYIVGNTLRYQDLVWYEALKNGKLKDEALLNKAIMEGTIRDEEESDNEAWKK